MTTLEDIYRFMPGDQASWPVSTSPFGSVVSDSFVIFVAELAFWRAIQAPPNYNAPVTWPVPGEFAPLVELASEAQRSVRAWRPDTPADLAEQEENAWAFHESQLNVIFGQGD
jgi:hypothetical protein